MTRHPADAGDFAKPALWPLPDLRSQRLDLASLWPAQAAGLQVEVVSPGRSPSFNRRGRSGKPVRSLRPPGAAWPCCHRLRSWQGMKRRRLARPG